MIIPNDALCVKMVAEILATPEAFSPYAEQFALSNEFRDCFTDKQKELLHAFAQHFQFDCLIGIQPRIRT